MSCDVIYRAMYAKTQIMSSSLGLQHHTLNKNMCWRQERDTVRGCRFSFETTTYNPVNHAWAPVPNYVLVNTFRQKYKQPAGMSVRGFLVCPTLSKKNCSSDSSCPEPLNVDFTESSRLLIFLDPTSKGYDVTQFAESAKFNSH